MSSVLYELLEYIYFCIFAKSILLNISQVLNLSIDRLLKILGAVLTYFIFLLFYFILFYFIFFVLLHYIYRLGVRVKTSEVRITHPQTLLNFIRSLQIKVVDIPVFWFSDIHINIKGVFRTLSNIKDETVCKNS